MLFRSFCREEYQQEDGADFTDLANVGVAYTTTEDDKHEIQARVNLVAFRIETLADGKVVRSEQYASLEELTEKGLQALSFDDLVYLSEEELAQVEHLLPPLGSAPRKAGCKPLTFILKSLWLTDTPLTLLLTMSRRSTKRSVSTATMRRLLF